MRFRLLFLWSVRRCFVCDHLGVCRHRDVDYDVAWLEAAQAREVANATLHENRAAQTWLPGFAPEEIRRVQ